MTDQLNKSVTTFAESLFYVLVGNLFKPTRLILFYTTLVIKRTDQLKLLHTTVLDVYNHYSIEAFKI